MGFGSGSSFENEKGISQGVWYYYKARKGNACGSWQGSSVDSLEGVSRIFTLSVQNCVAAGRDNSLLLIVNSQPYSGI